MQDLVAKAPPAPSLFGAELEDILNEAAVLAVLTIQDANDAVPVARALVDGGVTAMELAWRTPATLDALAAIRREVPEMLAGIGTLLTIDQMQTVREAGAAFGVSPGLSIRLLEAAAELRFPYAPGIMTPSDIQVAVEHNCRLLKFFPAESSGGITHLKNMNAPFAHLGLRYIVLGGLNEDNAGEYLKVPSVSVLGGSWIASPELIARKDWTTITQRARRARTLVENR